VGRPHVAPGVVGGATGRLRHEIDDQLARLALIAGTGALPIVVALDNGRCPYALFSVGACAAQGNTGNLIGNDTPGLWNDDQCGGDPNNNTYSEVLTAYGANVVTRIRLIVDESAASTEQTVTIDPCISRA
jgi:hypothetical protein